jgi:hypothetical protein
MKLISVLLDLSKFERLYWTFHFLEDPDLWLVISKNKYHRCMQGKVPLEAFQIFDFPWPIGLGGSQIQKACLARPSPIPKACKDKVGARLERRNQATCCNLGLILPFLLYPQWEPPISREGNSPTTFLVPSIALHFTPRSCVCVCVCLSLYPPPTHTYISNSHVIYLRLYTLFHSLVIKMSTARCVLCPMGCALYQEYPFLPVSVCVCVCVCVCESSCNSSSILLPLWAKTL